jgi:hypothetical protein
LQVEPDSVKLKVIPPRSIGGSELIRYEMEAILLNRLAEAVVSADPVWAYCHLGPTSYQTSRISGSASPADVGSAQTLKAPVVVAIEEIPPVGIAEEPIIELKSLRPYRSRWSFHIYDSLRPQRSHL